MNANTKVVIESPVFNTAEEYIQRGFDVLRNQGVKQIKVNQTPLEGVYILEGVNPEGKDCIVLIAPDEKVKEEVIKLNESRKKSESEKTCKIEKKIEIDSTDKKEDINIKMTTANSNTTIINGLTYNISTRMGECGARGKDKKTLYFPFFLMGACGDDQAVISWNGVRERLVAPKKMNAKWFGLIATKLKQNPMFDYDWYSFSSNILEPNREHIKTELGISEEKVDRLLQDGGVFLNNYFVKSFAEEEGEDYDEDYKEGVNIGYYPNFANFLKYDNLEY
jgi:hypothetical protein